MEACVLVWEDDIGWCEQMKNGLAKEGITMQEADNLEALLEGVQKKDYLAAVLSLEQFAEENNYDLRKLQSNIKNAIYRLDTSKAEKNFEKYFSIEFDTYYLSPNKFVSLIVLILRS